MYLHGMVGAQKMINIPSNIIPNSLKKVVISFGVAKEHPANIGPDSFWACPLEITQLVYHI